MEHFDLFNLSIISIIVEEEKKKNSTNVATSFILAYDLLWNCDRFKMWLYKYSVGIIMMACTKKKKNMHSRVHSCVICHHIKFVVISDDAIH